MFGRPRPRRTPRPEKADSPPQHSTSSRISPPPGAPLQPTNAPPTPSDDQQTQLTDETGSESPGTAPEASTPPSRSGSREEDVGKKDGHFNRNMTIAGFVVTLIALGVAIFSVLQDRGRIDPTLTVVAFEPSVKGNLTAQVAGPMGESPSPLKDGVQGPAVTVSVLNSGDVPALVTGIKVTLKKAWFMNGCWGAGGSEITAIYDVPISFDQLKGPVPRVVSVLSDFEIAGNDIDTFTLAIGPGKSYEGSWPILYSVDVALVERSGEEVFAGSALLIDFQDAGSVDGIMSYAQDPTGDFYNPKCIAENFKIINDAADTPGERSPQIDELRSRMGALNLNSGRSAGPTETTAPAGEDAVGSWIVQLKSLDRSNTSDAEVEAARQELQQRLGLEVLTLNSGDFESLNPGYWVLYNHGRFKNGTEAAEVCTSRGIGTKDDCFGRYLSHDERDRKLACYVPGIDRVSICNRK